jgi:cytochrome c-type biogenesis protein CcsB
MDWSDFSIIAIITLMLWLGSIITIIPANRKKNILSLTFTIVGILVLIIFVVSFWISLERPPLKTLGETRLWYALFLAIIGLLTYVKWKFKWLMVFSLGMSSLFIMINYLNPEIHDKELVPALQSVWFIPHVLVYIFAYAILAASSIVALKGLFDTFFAKSKEETIVLADNLVYIGFAFLTLGLIFGAIWAKEAWGFYWTWDPKETWALITWLGYLLYIHFRYIRPKVVKPMLWLLALSFVLLLICWFGINYLPSAVNSVHTYS